MSETLESINAWANATFGVPTLSRCIERAGAEWSELEDEAAHSCNFLNGVVADEAADVVITLLTSPEVLAAVHAQMAVNRARAWRAKGDGTGQHVERAA